MGGKLPRPGYLHPRGASCPEAASPPGSKLPRVQDKPVHQPRVAQLDVRLTGDQEVTGLTPASRQHSFLEI